MFSLTRSIPVNQLLLEQGPVFLTSLLIAEFFYKFHSFTLECLAFLSTWYALDWVVRTLIQRRK